MLLAVHISDGVLAAPWWLGGFAAAGALLWLATRRLHDEEVPWIALLTAAVFISSSMHVPLGPVTVHLLLTGLVGVLLGRRAPLAVAVGLVMQALLLGHGGTTALGVNTCVIALPALGCGALFRALHGRRALTHGSGRALLVTASAGLLYFSGAYCLLLLGERFRVGWLEALPDATYLELLQTLAHPAVVLGGLAFAALAVGLERRLENAPEFPLGLLIGELAVLLTVGLTCAVVTLGAAERGEVVGLLALTLVLAHLPIALIEGVVLGVAVGFLAKVKPDLLDNRALDALRDPLPCEKIDLVAAADDR